MSRKRRKKRWSVAAPRRPAGSHPFAVQCPFCAGEMRMSKKGIGADLVITFSCTCGTKLDVVIVSDDYVNDP